MKFKKAPMCVNVTGKGNIRKLIKDISIIGNFKKSQKDLYRRKIEFFNYLATGKHKKFSNMTTKRIKRVTKSEHIILGSTLSILTNAFNDKSLGRDVSVETNLAILGINEAIEKYFYQ